MIVQRKERTKTLKTKIPLGKKLSHSRYYNPDHLFAVKRSKARESIGIQNSLPFYGADIWNAYELSWLNSKGKPIVAIAEVIFPCTTINIVESKSLKLYFNSFNQTSFETIEIVQKTIEKDLSSCAGDKAAVRLLTPEIYGKLAIKNPEGECIDHLDLEITVYQPDPSLLNTGSEIIHETLHSNLLRTNCPVTGQPDWATITIAYKGRKISREGILAYIISFREHSGFHENCVEKIFCDITEQCAPEFLSVYARFTRRGGIDINPFRSSEKISDFHNHRLARQ